MNKVLKKKIEDYEKNYFIYSNGLVWSKRNKDFLKPYKARGYLIVDLYKDGQRKKYYIHRLVASAFLENPNNYPQVNHKDEDKENNNVYNLEWCTHSENMIHAYKQGRLPKQVKENAEEFTKLKKESTEKRFKLLLKDKFINMIHTEKRVYVEYLCSSCNKYCKTRTDSALFLKSLTICNSCSRKK